MPFEGIHNEKQLLTQVSQGDRQAFQVLYKACYPLIQRYILLFEPSPHILDELTQDVFVRIWDKRARLADVESLRNYLFTVTRNVVYNYFRAVKAQQMIKGLDNSGPVAAGHDSEKELLLKQYYHFVEEAIGKLPAGRRKVLRMSMEQGLSLDEIAEELHISRSGVKKQLYAATAFIRQYLRDHGEMSLLLFVFLSLFEI